MQDIFLQIMEFIGQDGYYARTARELEVMSALEKQHLIYKKPGTKRVFIRDTLQTMRNNVDRSTFKQMLKKYFLESRTILQPFVPIADVRSKLNADGIPRESFDIFLIDLYDSNEAELEPSFTANEGKRNGLNYKNKKFFSYITNIE